MTQAPDDDVAYVLGGAEFSHRDGLLQKRLGILACPLDLGQSRGNGVGVGKTAHPARRVVRGERQHGDDAQRGLSACGARLVVLGLGAQVRDRWFLTRLVVEPGGLVPPRRRGPACM